MVLPGKKSGERLQDHWSSGILGTLDSFPGSDRIKALPFLGIFMFALRWPQAECDVRFVAAKLVFKSGTTLFCSTSGQVFS